MNANADALLADLEPLTHSARIRRMIELGRASARGDEEPRAVLAELRSSPEAYCRLLALYAANGALDGAAALASVSDPSRLIRRTAARFASILCTDAQLAEALARIIERRTVRRLLGALARRKRVAPIDAFLGGGLAKGIDPHLVDLLPLASDSLVESHFAAMEEHGSPLSWERLAVRHPALVSSALMRALTNPKKHLDTRQRYRFMPLLEKLAKGAPDATLKLIAALFDIGEEPSAVAGAIRKLLRTRPRETFDLLRARHDSARPVRPPGAFGIVRFDKVAHRLGPERLEYIIANAAGTLGDGKKSRRWFLRLSDDDKKAVLRAFLKSGRGSFGAFLFRHIPPEGPDAAARERAYERWSRAAQIGDGTISPEILDWLPKDLREREARRHLSQCETLASKPDRRNLYARLLPFDEAKTTLAPWLGHPEGEERAKAQRILLATVLHEPAAMSRALDSVKARKFEQDPVRFAMIDALAGLPVARYSIEHLPSVAAILQDALDAADLSTGTSGAAERLVVRLFRRDGLWGARWLTKLLETRGAVSTYGLGDNLTEPEVRALSPALAELAHDWATRERAGALINLAQSLNIRLSAAPPILDALARLSREFPFAGVASISIGLLKAYARPRFTELVPSLIAEDKSFVLLPAVASFISLKRQDLLAPLLESKPMTGRFATGRTHWVIDFDTGHNRWTACQQQRYSEGLVMLLREEKRDVPTLSFAIKTLVRLAFVDASAVLPFASDPRPPVREITIRAIPRLDAGQGIPVLIESLGDDRARWAIYALRKSFSEMPRSRVLEELRAVPTTKVTVAKEVVRLLGEMGGEEAYRDLLALDRPGVHRDVRIALLRALWDHLDRAPTWAIFERAAADPDWVVSVKLADIPLGRLSTEAEARVVELLTKILARAEPEARLDLLKRAAYLPLRDERRSLFSRLLDHMGTKSTDEARAALEAVLWRMTPGEASAVIAKLSELAPKRRHLVVFVPVLVAKTGPYAAGHHVRVAEGLLSALKGDPLAVPYYIDLVSRLRGWKDLAEAFVHLSGRDLLHHDAMASAIAAVKHCVHPEVLEERLAKERDPKLRRLALAALEQAASPNHGWTKERRARLQSYQHDPSPAVSGPASFVFPPE